MKMLYPDIETYRMEEETFHVPDLRQSNLERNCSQFFVKGPALTKDFLEKMNADIVPKKTYLFGRVLNTKKILLHSGLSLLCLLSFVGVIVMWCTDIFDDFVLSNTIISNTSKHFDMWKKPSPKPTVKIYIFNYTNLEDYENRLANKLHVQEVGPYAYEESLERVNINFHDDMVSFQLKRSYRFLPNLSKGRQNDRVNVPQHTSYSRTGAAITKYHNYFARLAFSGVLTSLGEKAFVNLAADSLIRGYNTNFYDITKSLAKLGNEKQPEKVALLANKIGLQPTVYTMNTGRKDISRVGTIEKVNGKEHFDYWSTAECNSVSGADGGAFPAKSVQLKETLSYLLPEMCRTVPFKFDGDVTILDGKVPAHRYAIPEDIFDSADEIPDHHLGAPMFVSYPHFYRADRALFHGVSGLSDAKRDISTYMNLHPIVGFTMSGKARLQINIQVQKAFGMYQLDRYEDGLMLPIAWAEMEVNEKTLPQDFFGYHLRGDFYPEGYKTGIQMGCATDNANIATGYCFAFNYRLEEKQKTG
ncbi:hypothetical protein NQ317_005034 [Molorchus minor]|uniref:Scavenger receptor class B member 1 n=1 Tax=Molorchus minor TaxID=1323400 RepID=A0ABQ9JW61_9CUCU|nr:hypothetical protein NQ317_005034 [Molorchus minor]